MIKQEIKNELLSWISEACPPEAAEWLEKNKMQVERAESFQPLLSAFTMAPRKMGKTSLNLNEEQRKKAGELKLSWTPTKLTLNQGSRILLLLSYPSENAEEYVEVVKKILAGADMNEQIAVYAALPLYPHPKKFLDVAYEGTRSNITEVFDTIALDNPYPYKHFPDKEFNRLVLKAAFMERPFMRIVGVEKRSNPALANLLLDLVSERWAAGRKISPMLWKLIIPALKQNYFEQILIKAEKQDKLTKQAIELALQDTSQKRCTSAGNLEWANIQQEWENSQTT